MNSYKTLARPQEGHRTSSLSQDGASTKSLSSRYIPVRTRTIVEQLTVTDIAEALSDDELAKRLQESGYRWFKSDLQYALWAEKACEAL